MTIFLFFSGAEYGTTEAGWKAVLVESDRRCDLHMRVKDDLHSNVINQLKQWQKDNYHKVSTIISLLDNAPNYLGSWVQYPKYIGYFWSAI